MQKRSIGMENAIIIAILVVLIGGAIWYIVKEKKKGTKCIGCPNSGSCSSKGCGCKTDTR